MGTKYSTNNNDKVENKGQFSAQTTNITMSDSVEVHNDIVIILLLIITLLMIAQFIMKMCRRYQSRLHKRFQSQYRLNTLLTQAPTTT